jgi:hypothetical protein
MASNDKLISWEGESDRVPNAHHLREEFSTTKSSELTSRQITKVVLPPTLSGQKAMIPRCVSHCETAVGRRC